MNKIIFLLLLISKLNSLYAFIEGDTLYIKNEFEELTIRHQYGDEHYTVEEMKFVKKDNRVLAIITRPNHDLIENSKTELTKSNISLLDKFLSKAYEFEKNCAEEMTSSYVRYYFLNIDGQEIEITKFCKWGDLNYNKLKEQIFGSYLRELEKKREQLNLEKNELLIGSWKYDFSIHKIEKGKIYTLNRIKSKYKENCILKFKKDQKLVDYYCLRNSKTKYDFRFDILNEDLILYINGENKNERKDFVYGYVFKVLELNENEIKLTTLN
ncbi:hypothetical protein M0D21_02505 [Aquimarina sp. D1M17]|uniref:hypothetical protein n=1 Tax=Aquimarina acroporae TaxID=2937283 RepID=UPI0020BD519E|nr:hypothetical protein [Aquimarina acroporae]MCK8520419.1 hypothetical protein [Aquimarina acroporae]